MEALATFCCWRVFLLLRELDDEVFPRAKVDLDEGLFIRGSQFISQKERILEI